MRPFNAIKAKDIKAPDPEWWAQALAAYLSGENVKAIANRFGKGAIQVYVALKKQGVVFETSSFSSSNVDWASQDWSQTSRTIAENLGCSIDSVCRARRRLGAPKSNSRIGWNSHNPERRILIEGAITKGDMTMRETAENFEICVATVRRYARQLKQEMTNETQSQSQAT